MPLSDLVTGLATVRVLTFDLIERVRLLQYLLRRCRLQDFSLEAFTGTLSRGD